MNYVDSHVHLQECSQPELVLQQAVAAGVKTFVCNAIAESDWPKVMDLGEKHPEVRVCLGIHPMSMLDLHKGWDKHLEILLRKNPQFMVGETGLDKTLPKFERQQEVFAKQLLLAQKLRRPVHLHCYKAWPEMMTALRSCHLEAGFIMHSHHGDASLIPELVERGAYLSYSTLLEREECKKVRECLRATPANRLLIESDAPDLASSPTEIPRLLRNMAKIRNENPEILSRQIRQNLNDFLPDSTYSLGNEGQALAAADFGKKRYSR